MNKIVSRLPDCSERWVGFNFFNFVYLTPPRACAFGSVYFCSSLCLFYDHYCAKYCMWINYIHQQVYQVLGVNERLKRLVQYKIDCVWQEKYTFTLTDAVKEISKFYTMGHFPNKYLHGSLMDFARDSKSLHIIR